MEGSIARASTRLGGLTPITAVAHRIEGRYAATARLPAASSLAGQLAQARASLRPIATELLDLAPELVPHPHLRAHEPGLEHV